MCKIITTFAPSKNVGVVIRKPTVIHFNRIKQSITHSTQPPRQATNVRDMCALIKGFFTTRYARIMHMLHPYGQPVKGMGKKGSRVM